jgi:hypothetical protein
MQEEANGDEENEEEDSRPSKKTRNESIVLDEEEAQIASGLRESSRQVAMDRARSEDVDSRMDADDDEQGEQVGAAIDDYGGTEFDNNGVCP